MTEPTFAFVPSHHTLFAVKGLKARNFLQGQTSNDLSQLKLGESCLALRLDLKGRVVANLRIWALSDELFMLRCHQTMAQTLIKGLSKFAIFSGVKIEEIHQSYSLIYYVGSISQFKMHLTNKLMIQDFEPDQANYWPSLVHSKLERYEILIEKKLPVTKKQQDLINWQSLDWQDKIVDVDHAKSGLYLAHYINMVEGYISFNKGCFLGQEIVARMEHLGRIKYKLLQAQFVTTNHGELHLNSGQNITDKQQIIGTIIQFLKIRPDLTLTLIQCKKEFDKSQIIPIDEFTSLSFK